MTVTLTPELESKIRREVASGRYATETDVLDDAMQLLDKRNRLEALRASIAEADAQIDRGEYVVWSPELMDELDREAEEMDRLGIEPHADVCP